MSDRYQREIEDILRQAGELGSGKGSGRRRRGFFALVGSYVGQSLSGRLWAITPGRVMLAAVVVLLLAVVAGSITSGLAPLLGFAGLLLFIVGYAMFFIKPPKTEKRWRGQPIEYDDSLWSRLRGRLGRSNG